MKTDGNRRLVMYDPGCFLPYYLDSLCRHLSQMGLRPRVIASPPLFEPVDSGSFYDFDELFFPSLRGRARSMIRDRRILRRVVKAFGYPAGIARTWRDLSRGPPGVLHVQWAPVPALDVRLVRALKRRGWRVVYTVHDPLPSPRRLGARRRHLELLALTDALVVHAPQQLDELARAAPAVGPRTHVIPHGATRAPLPTPAERAQCRAALHVESDRPVLLFFGQLKPYKGLDHLLTAMPDVIARFPGALLIIAGEPLMSLRSLERRIDELRLHDHVSLRPGFVAHGDVPRYLRAADLLVAPYVKIGVSGVVVLAQSHGLPVVVTRVGGLTAFVEHNGSGLLVPPGDPRALARAICHGLADPEALAAMGRRAWERLGTDNRWTDVAKRTYALYAGLGRGSPPAEMVQLHAAGPA